MPKPPNMSEEEYVAALKVRPPHISEADYDDALKTMSELDDDTLSEIDRLTTDGPAGNYAYDGLHPTHRREKRVLWLVIGICAALTWLLVAKHHPYFAILPAVIGVLVLIDTVTSFRNA